MNMRSVRSTVARGPVAVSVLASLLCALVVVGGPGVAGAVTNLACGPAWSIVPSSSKITDPRSIAAISANNVWIVGSQPQAGVKVQTAAEHWNGTTWTVVSTPDSGSGENALNSVTAITKNDIWAVGYWQPVKKTDASFHTLTEHWNGTSWSVVASPTVGTESNTLTGVSAISTNDVWATGYYFSGRVRQTLTEHWDGTSWSVVTSPDPGTQSNSLFGVDAMSTSDVWATGFTNSGSGYQALIEHWDGTSWSVVPGASDPGALEDVLAGVSATAANDVWAFGYHVIGSTFESLTEHWDGTSWSIVNGASSPDGVVTVLRGGSAIPGDAWGVGFGYDIKDGRYKAFSENWNGTSWTAVPTAIAQTKDKSEMWAVSHVPGSTQVWASGRSADVETICPGSGSVRRSGHAAVTRAHVASTQGFATRPGTPGAIPGIVKPAAPGFRLHPAIAVTAEDVAAQAGLGITTLTHGAVVADYNNDGLPDIFLSRDENPGNLYLNNGDGTFTQVDVGEFPHRDRHGCSTADVNHDGLLDIFCNTGSDRGTEAKRDELYIQQSNGTFKDLAYQYGILQPFDRGRNSAFIDANNDGWADVLATNFPDRADGMPSSNRLYLSQAGTRYQMAPTYGLDQEINGASISVGDYNNDGWPDVLIASEAGIKLFRNNGGTGFTDVTNAVGLNHRANFVQFADMNSDGRLDVVEADQTKVKVNLQQPNGTFKPAYSTTVDSGQAVATGDVNGDGAPDIYVLEGKTSTSDNAPDEVLLNGGGATSFTAMAVPSTDQGSAEAVTPIDYDGNGLTDFLVENGNGGKPGPVQLIAFFPS